MTLLHGSKAITNLLRDRYSITTICLRSSPDVWRYVVMPPISRNTPPSIGTDGIEISNPLSEMVWQPPQENPFPSNQTSQPPDRDYLCSGPNLHWRPRITLPVETGIHGKRQSHGCLMLHLAYLVRVKYGHSSLSWHSTRVHL